MGDSKVTIVEVGPRDGLQYESIFFPTAKKIELVDRLSETGLKRIEVTSFVNPKVIPNLCDAKEVLNGINKRKGILYSALVPNLRGCQRALESSVDDIALFVSASEIHNHKNVGMSVADSLHGFREIADLCREAGRSIRGYVVTAFGCPFEGRIEVGKVIEIVEAYIDLGASEVSLGDTTGMANPRQVKELFGQLVDYHENLTLASHFHNSRGLGLVNALAAFEAGITVFDCSVAGVGGCPTAIGAMGNIATEDFVNLMEEMGVETGVDFDKLIFAAELIKEVLDTEPASYTFKQGRPNWSGLGYNQL